jgi:hypothetical protein
MFKVLYVHNYLHTHIHSLIHLTHLYLRPYVHILYVYIDACTGVKILILQGNNFLSYFC